ncbi:ABC transporter ATP-binding protein [Limobrevibacterium gyesilva]|uniref:ABC transporter ATP-binding protein n=1 Tax=Limobrevibacterium gyesilva TaxID=2991712 RepID=A0AA42CFZ7_9PROT|nr:ABC transporter ATP-binding protein [Limobrevibacterium gyesilva]MCW3473507.1 ABC transporter ATP-binding protein [Limobrevibacterium gyesilva]
MLELRALQSGYGETQVLFDVSLSVAAGEVVALLGRNGMGKTTTIRAIMGLLPVRGGQLAVDGASVAGLKPFQIAQMGLGLVPEGRQVFPTLTVEENLVATARAGRWTLADVFALFPRLQERRRQLARLLSGGEQQMLAIGRALMTNPRLLILDEATEGLAPLIRAEIWACLARLKAERLAILLIDKTLDALMKLADRHVIIEKGVTVWSGNSAELAAAPDIRARYLHL